MELDEFKLTWKSGMAVQQSSLLELQHRLRQKSRSQTLAIRRNVWIEIVMYLVFMGLAVAAWKQFTVPHIRVVAMLTWVVSIIFLLYLFQLLRFIRHYETATASLKEGMSALVRILEKFKETYVQLTVVTLFVAFCVGLLGGITTVNEHGISGQFLWKKAGLIYVACFVVWSVCLYFFSRWYLHRMYGMHIEQLKQQLQEMENG